MKKFDNHSSVHRRVVWIKMIGAAEGGSCLTLLLNCRCFNDRSLPPSILVDVKAS